MSRIYDALKKAEREKAASTVPEVPAGATENTAPVGDYPRGFHTIMADSLATSAAALLRTLEERCPKCTWNPDPKTILFFHEQNHMLGTEEFRTLRSRICMTRKRQPLQKLLITSPLPREGKSFVAANLAAVMVHQPEHRVLLIDADLRSPRLHRSLGTPLTPGLSDYLSGEVDEISVVQRGCLDNFFFIPGGKSVPNPSELIGNGRLRLLLNRLTPAFDWIILDSPPAVPVSDAKLLADLCDGVIVLILAGVTPFDLAQKACQEFRERQVLGVVLNRVAAGSAYSSYYYGHKRRENKE
jgi:capsular exopolysaccharide synthesis family protein